MRLIPILAVTIALSGCSSPMGNKSSIDREARALNAQLQVSAQNNARHIRIGGKTFRVAVVETGSYETAATNMNLSDFTLKKTSAPYALVSLVNPIGTSYRAIDVESAARSVSGCRATLNAGVLAFVGGFNAASTDLSRIEAKVTNFKGWRADLDC